MNKNKFDKTELNYLKQVLNLEDSSATRGNFTETLEKKSCELFEN
jgi:hypothetical protein